MTLIIERKVVIATFRNLAGIVEVRMFANRSEKLSASEGSRLAAFKWGI